MPQTRTRGMKATAGALGVARMVGMTGDGGDEGDVVGRSMMLGEEAKMYDKTGLEDLSHDATARSLMCGTIPASNHGKEGRRQWGGGATWRRTLISRSCENIYEKPVQRDKLKDLVFFVYN